MSAEATSGAVRAEADAWILSVGDDRYAAVGAYEIVHLLTEAPVLFRIPLAPAHCRSVMLWEDRLLPVVDLRALMSDGAEAVEATRYGGMEHLIAVVGYLPDPALPPEFGALLLATPPTRARVTDEDACEVERSIAQWERVLAAQFYHPAFGAVPVLDLRRVFGANAAVTRQ